MSDASRVLGSFSALTDNHHTNVDSCKARDASLVSFFVGLFTLPTFSAFTDDHHTNDDNRRARDASLVSYFVSFLLYKRFLYL